MVCLVVELVGSCGAWFQCRYGGFWVSSYKLISPGVRSSLVFSGFAFKPPFSGFQFYSYSSLKTSPSLTSKAVPSVLASVCWSLQCLISTLTQGGGGGHFYAH